VDYNDHFETPSVAYGDLVPYLITVCASLGKEPGALVIYDPYYCQGAMKEHLAHWGFTTVINENRDFYADVAASACPAYDVLVTNPPFSGEHKQRLLDFLGARDMPFALLLPTYTAAKRYWRDFAALNGDFTALPAANANASAAADSDAPPRGSGGARSSASSGRHSLLYVMPPDSYEYLHPEGTGKEAPPFYSSWFLGFPTAPTADWGTLGTSGPRDMAKGGAAVAAIAVALKEKLVVETVKHCTQRRPPRKPCLLLNSLKGLEKRGYVEAGKRPNAKQRRKMDKP
jgi:hypothetical protein